MPGPGHLLRAVMDFFPGLGPALNRAAGATATMQKIARGEIRSHMLRSYALPRKPGNACP
jgi:hypothetical protein